ncbi:MAG TPA: hypothetical protein VF493_15685 [Terriglobales bacterium]
MPTSEVAITSQADYNRRLEAFFRKSVTRPGRGGVVEAFHTVRRMPYFSGPDRSPLAALANDQGACTAKHVLLRDLLHRLGEPAVVEIVEGDFSAGIPIVPSMPLRLKERIRRGGVTDFHCRVVWCPDRAECLLDATWPDALAQYGFPVNSDWDGTNNTRPAIVQVVPRSRNAAVLDVKQKLLDALPQDAAEDRRNFLKMLSEWLGRYAQEASRH